jgi:hypothetical protein
MNVGVFSYHEYWSSKLLRNAGTCLPDYKALMPEDSNINIQPHSNLKPHFEIFLLAMFFSTKYPGLSILKLIWYEKQKDYVCWTSGQTVDNNNR